MGFLDHSTNNIIVDAVLTDRGRELLAGQNSNIAKFSITKFSLSDDEVDYTIIKKYGRTVGKEKITKNTPIFEAQTKAYLAQKHRMVSLSNPLVKELPTLSVAGALNFYSNQQSNQITVKTELNNQTQVPPELVDNQYYVSIPSKLLSLGSNLSPVDVDESTALLYATYVVKANDRSVPTTIPLVQRTIDSALLSVYGDTSGVISALITIVGASSGARVDLPLTTTNSTL